jgi:hypothetical protein
VGQVAWAFPQIPSGRSPNENRSRTSARARRGVVSANGNEKKRSERKENFKVDLNHVSKNLIGQKTILISFPPITYSDFH